MFTGSSGLTSFMFQEVLSSSRQGRQDERPWERVMRGASCLSFRTLRDRHPHNRTLAVTTIQMGTCPRLQSFGEIPRQLIDTFASFPRPLKCIHTVTFQLHIHMDVIELFFQVCHQPCSQDLSSSRR